MSITHSFFLTPPILARELAHNLQDVTEFVQNKLRTGSVHFEVTYIDRCTSAIFGTAWF
jgi:hypothetical protein